VLHIYRLLAFSVVFLCAVVLLAGEISLKSFKSTKAKAATIRYKEAIKAADTLYQRTLEDARHQYINDLNEAKVEAMKTGNLEEAIRLRDAIQEVETAEPANSDRTSTPKRESLVAKLVNSTWLGNKNEKIEYFANGTGSHNTSTFKWAAIDDRRIVWYWPNTTYVTYVVFNQEMTSFAVYSLGHTESRKTGPSWKGTRVK